MQKLHELLLAAFLLLLCWTVYQVNLLTGTVASLVATNSYVVNTVAEIKARQGVVDDKVDDIKTETIELRSKVEASLEEPRDDPNRR